MLHGQELDLAIAGFVSISAQIMKLLICRPPSTNKSHIDWPSKGPPSESGWNRTYVVKQAEHDSTDTQKTMMWRRHAEDAYRTVKHTRGAITGRLTDWLAESTQGGYNQVRIIYKRSRSSQSDQGPQHQRPPHMIASGYLFPKPTGEIVWRLINI